MILFLAALIAGAGWAWHHEVQQITRNSIINTGIATVVLFIIGLVGAFVLLRFLQRRAGLADWANDLPGMVTTLVAWGYGAGFALLLPDDLWRAGYFILWCIFGIMYFRRIGRRHAAWQPVADAVLAWGALSLYVFVVLYCINFADHKYSILDPHNLSAIHVVLYRALTFSLLWLALLAVMLFVAWPFGKKMRTAAVWGWATVWSLLFFVELINLGLLYFSGLGLSPVALDHAEGSNGILLNPVSIMLIIAMVAAVVVAVVLARYFTRKLRGSRALPWWTIGFALIVLAIGGTIKLNVIYKSPQYAVAKSFYDRYIVKVSPISLSDDLQQKLARFGLRYRLDQFNVAEREAVFQKPLQAMPQEIVQKKPNVVIILWESLSSRLTGVYNEKLKDVTPGLQSFADNPQVTIFHNYYNSSTPTITGTLSQLCSFLPPTGHQEIEKERKVQALRLSCLPQILRENGWQHAEYVTAVSKDFANKDALLASIGVDRMYGTDELRAELQTEPLSWGYSDHQMFPFVQSQMEKLPQPFLEMLATVDTHPPFTVAQDMMYFGNGKNTVLNSFHTTDDAFLQFWQWFAQSEFARNTILVVVGDHAAFPSWPIQQTITDGRGEQLTFYDENFLGIYVPQSMLPKRVDTYSSGLDLTPTLLHMLNFNAPNVFEGHSIFDDRDSYPNILGMHELGLYINQQGATGKRQVDYSVPSALNCPSNSVVDPAAPLTPCEFKLFYQWKREMMEQGRLWYK